MSLFNIVRLSSDDMRSLYFLTDIMLYCVSLLGSLLQHLNGIKNLGILSSDFNSSRAALMIDPFAGRPIIALDAASSTNERTDIVLPAPLQYLVVDAFRSCRKNHGVSMRVLPAASQRQIQLHSWLTIGTTLRTTTSSTFTGI